MESVNVPNHYFAVAEGESALVAKDYGKAGMFVAELALVLNVGLLMSGESLSAWLNDIRGRDPDDADPVEIVFDGAVHYGYGYYPWKNIDIAKDTIKVLVTFSVRGPLTVMTVVQHCRNVVVTLLKTADLVCELEALQRLMETNA